MEQFLYLGPFGSIWSFLWSSSQVLVHLVGICLFLVQVCREWRWISWTRIHVFHHVMAFSSLISFLMSFWVIRCVFPLWGLPRVLLVLLLYRLSIQPFRYASTVAIFSSKIVRFLWRLVVGMFLCHALPIVEKIFFSCFGTSCFVCIVLPFVDISLVFLLSLEPSSSCTVIFSRVVFSILFPHILGPFCFTILACFRNFFIWVSSRTSHPGLDCFFVLFRGPQFSHTLILPLHLTQIYYLLICKVAFDLFCLFLFLVFSILGFLMMGGWSSHCS